MDKEQCGNFGVFGFQDGYCHPSKLCKMGECPDANDCSNKMKEDLGGANYLMRIFQNKERGLKKREEEQKAAEFAAKEKIRLDTEKMNADKKAKEEKAVEDKKVADEAQKKLDEEKETTVAKVEVYSHTCPHCGKQIKEGDISTEDEGKTIRHNECKGKVKLAKEPVKEEPKKDEKKAELEKKEENLVGPENKSKEQDVVDGNPAEKKPDEEKK